MHQSVNDTQVSFENEVFVGDSQQDTHGEYEGEQLTTIQKRIWLIEFLIMVGYCLTRGEWPCQNKQITRTGRALLVVVRKLIVKNTHRFIHLRTFKKKRLEI